MVIGQLQTNKIPEIKMLPFRGSFTRGILAAVYTKSDLSIESAYELYCNYYAEHPFVEISERNPDIKQVVNTNKAILYLDKYEDELLIVSVIDNLVKGASGQAVQNMNLMFGLEETSGLQLKASAF
jgi:N-acetyl-gamma-glutamyl-phosphate reductase